MCNEHKDLKPYQDELDAKAQAMATAITRYNRALEGVQQANETKGFAYNALVRTMYEYEQCRAKRVGDVQPGVCADGLTEGGHIPTRPVEPENIYYKGSQAPPDRGSRRDPR